MSNSLDDFANAYGVTPEQPAAHIDPLPETDEPERPQYRPPKEMATMPQVATASEVAETGMRGWANRTLGMKLAPSAAEQLDNKWVQQMNYPLRHTKYIAVFSTKGGVGKTVTLQGVASTIGSHRKPVSIIGLDFDAASGLAERMVSNSGTRPTDSVRSFFDKELRTGKGRRPSHQDITSYASTNTENLEVMAGAKWSRDDRLDVPTARAIAAAMEGTYNLVFIDLPGAEESDVARDVLDWCDGLIYVIETKADAFSVGLRGLDAIAERRPELLASTVVVLNHRTNEAVNFSLDDAYSRIAGMRQGEQLEVYELDYDAHIGAGGPMSLSQMSPSTRRTLRKIAGNLMESLPRAERPGLSRVLNARGTVH